MKSKLERLKLGMEPAFAPLVALGGKKGWKSALEMGQAAAERASRAIEVAASELKESGAAFKIYVASDEFEQDLDALARRLGIDGGVYPSKESNRWVRVSAKSRYLLLRARDQIMGRGSFNSKVALALTIAFAGAKIGHQGTQAFQVFSSSRSVPVSESA